MKEERKRYKSRLVMIVCGIRHCVGFVFRSMHASRESQCKTLVENTRVLFVIFDTLMHGKRCTAAIAGFSRCTVGN